ncbi:MAG TPA: AAA family ATPase [bacterium]|nr:AAA family ATPase [bacterium]
MLQELFSIHQQIVGAMRSDKKRYLAPKINWQNHCICLRGPRGTGKTTLLLQHYKETYGSPDRCLYISGDNIHVVSNGLYQTVRDYFTYGGEAIIIDEIHKYPNWAQELKNSIDTYKDKHILVSGSSSLDLTKAAYDLSRRVVYYDLPGLSFREYLYFRHGYQFPVRAFDDIVNGHTAIAADIAGKLPLLKHFDEYLRVGYYPYILEGAEEYAQKVMSTVEKTLFEDIAVTANLTQPKLPILKKMLWLIATSDPFVPNIAGMSRDLGISKEYVYTYLEYLERAGLIATLRLDGSGAALVRKPGKVYLENPNLLYALNGSLQKETLIGGVREAFFANQLKNAGIKVSLHPAADFLVNGRFTVEVGGPSKKEDQIKGIADSFRALDGIDIGAGDKIPLHLFGFLY